MIQVISNGPATAGQPPATIEDLIELLAEQPLDPTFEEFGDFVTRDPDGKVLFFGNFARRSHVFNLVTDEPELIETLTRLIRQNQASAEYHAARAVYRPCSRCGKLAMFCFCDRTMDIPRPKMRRLPHVNLRLPTPETAMERTGT